MSAASTAATTTAAASSSAPAAARAPAATQPAAHHGGTEGSDALDAGNAAILARLRELEAQNQALQKSVEDTRAEAHRKEEKIKELSIEKRKEMEEMISTAIDSWLNSLPEVSDEVKKQFRTGISRIAETADTRNAAWEVVCNASKLHTANVNRIEELISTCNQQSETIKTLVGSGGGDAASFASDASRMAKRPRTEGAAVPGGTAAPTGGASEAAGGQRFNDAWDAFGDLLQRDSRTQYGW